ncbi:MAG TPA: alpha/beta hydrolase [Azospirillaceae bacterium]|nr:alpha/beta hydrolase [Azospirillaceae bacterium]
MAKSSAVRRLLKALGVVVLLMAAAGVFYWQRPLTVAGWIGQVRMWKAGIESGYATVGSHRVHYLAQGEGEPLVLVHGFASDATFMVPVLVSLSKHYRVYAPDLLGYGKTDRPADGYSIAAQSTLVTGFIETMGLKDVRLVGLSMGGWVSMHAAAERPELVRKLVLADSSGITFEVTVDRGVFFPKAEEDIAKLRQVMGPPDLPPFPGFVARDLVRRLQGMAFTNGRMVESMLTGADLMDERLDEIRAPTLVYWGAADRLTPVAVGERIAAGIPGARLVATENCGHLAILTCRAQFLDAALPFLKD